MINFISFLNKKKAITKIEEMTKWYFPNIADFKPVTEFKTEFNVVSGGRNFFHKEFSRESCIAGWNYFINNKLVEYLNG